MMKRKDGCRKRFPSPAPPSENASAKKGRPASLTSDCSTSLCPSPSAGATPEASRHGRLVSAHDSNPSCPFEESSGDSKYHRDLPALLGPPEVLAVIGGFCCRQNLDSLKLTSKTIHEACSDVVNRPWPTNGGCPLVRALLSDGAGIPIKPDALSDHDFSDNVYLRWQEDVRLWATTVTPPPSKLVMINGARESSFLALFHKGIDTYGAQGWPVVRRPPMMQVWNKEYGLVYHEEPSGDSYIDMKPSITPPLDGSGSQFLVLPTGRGQPPGVRFVEMVSPSQSRKRGAEQIAQTFHLPRKKEVGTIDMRVKCIKANGGASLLFMDGVENAVKICRIKLEQGNRGIRQLTLGDPSVLTSHPNSKVRQQRNILASFSNFERSIIVFAFDSCGQKIYFYDLERRVSAAVLAPKIEGANLESGWLSGMRDFEFSPDGKMLVVAHSAMRANADNDGPDSMEYACAISVFDCDVQRIESISHRRPKTFPIIHNGFITDISFSPRGTNIAFKIHDSLSIEMSRLSSPLDKCRVGIIDLSPLADSDGGSQVRVEYLNETTWERFSWS